MPKKSLSVMTNSSLDLPSRITSDAYAKSRRWRLALLIGAALFPMLSTAAEREAIGTVTKLYSYTQFGGGDIMIEVSNPVAGCDRGYWLSPQDLGFKTTYALLLSMYHTQEQVRVGGDDTQLWTGSQHVYCRITFVGAL
jgi:hypothetical protein